jgi:hypothetical protein
MTEPAVTTTIGKCHRPGFLVEPLGWVADRLAKAIEAEPSLINLLFDINQPRMHLIALALAHLPNDVSPELALILFKGFRKPILNLSLGHHQPVGIDRALHRLPPKVLSAESYRSLIELLDDPIIAKFLHHRQSIDEEIITGFSNLPAALRRLPILAMFDQIDGMNRFAEGLRCLAARAGLTFDALATEIGSLNQPNQVIGKIKQLIESLPLLATLPPVKVGPYRRIDQIAEIRSLAKDWQNCLADCLHGINDVTCTIYRTDPPDQPAACLVYRQWRLGWFLQGAKGPRNIDLPPDQLAQTFKVFSDAGVYKSSIIAAIKSMILNDEWSRDRHPIDYDDILDDMVPYCD